SGTVDQVRSELGIQGLAPEENPPDLSVGIVKSIAARRKHTGSAILHFALLAHGFCSLRSGQNCKITERGCRQGLRAYGRRVSVA
ncbi:hypothetical protein, partial [Micromonospora sp. NPDC048830]|uniref:hypothetical protein n=1 Tax=Micromonospora sp. NPDC048830 TaxID=3364257 RepID=UPI00371A4657